MISKFDQFFKGKKEIFAGIIRHHNLDGTQKWVIVSFGVHKNITRNEGLALKDIFSMRSTSTGYEGTVNTEVYKNGGKIQQNGKWVTI